MNIDLIERTVEFADQYGHDNYDIGVVIVDRADDHVIVGLHETDDEIVHSTYRLMDKGEYLVLIGDDTPPDGITFTPTAKALFSLMYA